MAFKIKSGRKTVPKNSQRPFVRGSIPPSLYSPRIKPLDQGTRDYGKPDEDKAGRPGFGLTGLTGES